MDALLMMLYLVMAVFLVLLAIFLVRFLLKWKELKDEEMDFESYRFRSNARDENLVKVPTPRYRLEGKKCYFLLDRQSKEGYRLLRAYLALDVRGVCVTHFDPAGIRKRFDLPGTRFIWLTREKEGGGRDVRHIPPTSLGFLLQGIEERMGGDTLVYLDAAETVFKQNGTERTHKFLKNLKALVERKGAILLMSVGPSGINKRERELLANNFKELGAKAKKG